MSSLDVANGVINQVRAETDECILFLSFGKDSLVLLDLVAPLFRRVVCVYMYFVKGLEHIEMFARWCKKRYPNIIILQVPHWTLSSIYKNGFLCQKNEEQKNKRLRDVVDAVKSRTGIGYCFLGMKRADGMNRNIMITKTRDNNYISNDLCYPLAEMTQKEVLAYIKQNKIPEPIRYTNKRCGGGVGFDLDTFLFLREKYPNDLKKIYEVFPQSENILYNYDKRTNQNKTSYERNIEFVE